MIKYNDMEYSDYCDIKFNNTSRSADCRFEHSRGILTTHCKYIIPFYCNHRNVDDIRLIDVGCANGFLDEVIRENLPQYEVKYYGIEISPASVKYAQGINRNVMLGDICNPNTAIINQYHTFDILIARQMLQFCCDIEKAINNMFELLKTGGYLYLVQSIPYVMKDIELDDKSRPHHYNSVDNIDDIICFFKDHTILMNSPLFYGEHVFIVKKR